MNRIILIGNGFDLAHDLATCYKQFIDYLWQEKIKKIILRSNSIPNGQERIYNDGDIEIVPLYILDHPIESYKDLKKKVTDNEGRNNIEFQNKFLGKITEIVYNQNDKNPYKDKKELNWVDIEIEYYDSLKQVIIPGYQSKSDPTNDFKYESVTDLHKDFQRVKDYLVEYLKEIIEKKEIKKDNNIHKKLYFPIRYRDCTEKTIDQKTEEEYKKIEPIILDLQSEKTSITDYDIVTQRLLSNIGYIVNPKNEIRERLKIGDKIGGKQFYPENILFLNFNYTTLEEKYYDEIVDRPLSELIPINLHSIHIHGSFKDPYNYPKIFGYGDEMDDYYKIIENSNENEYLENIKSIKYFETDNYKRLLGFINKGEYQVFLFGHSCGVSDRVLLNTLFEHENCVSIKPFYYIDEKGKDNYSDIIRNISRHFNDKAVMRDKIVPKVYCEPLVE